MKNVEAILTLLRRNFFFELCAERGFVIVCREIAVMFRFKIFSSDGIANGAPVRLGLANDGTGV